MSIGSSPLVRVGLLAALVCWASAVSGESGPQAFSLASEPERCAEQALHTWLARGYGHFTVRLLRPAPSGVLLNATETARARPIAWAGLPTPRMTVWVDILSPSRASRAVPVAFEVHAYATAWTAVDDIRPAAAPLRKVQFTQASVDVTAMTAEPWSGPVDGYRLRRPLLAGQAITPSHVERVTAVTRGQPVEVCVANGELRIDAQAQALQDGQIGDVIPIRLRRAAEPVVARVTGPGAVEVVW